jgi:hypothetical protein
MQYPYSLADPLVVSRLDATYCTSCRATGLNGYPEIPGYNGLSSLLLYGTTTLKFVLLERSWWWLEDPKRRVKLVLADALCSTHDWHTVP